MGSLVPFQDLNHMPDPQATASSSAGLSAGATTGVAPGFLVPKIEPKTEPIDEWQGQNHSVSAFFSNSQNTPPPPPSSSSSSGDSDVYAEFNRVSELFRSAFAARLERYGDLSVIDAIDPVPEGFQLPTSGSPSGVGDNRLSKYVVSPRPSAAKFQRPQELARVAALGLEDQKHFREIVKRTRMIYDSLRIFLMTEEMKQFGVGCRRRARGDLRASSLMRECGLWLNQDKHIVGSIPGIHVGDLFFYRMELCVLGLHGQPQAGIDYLTAWRSSNGEPIATSIIVSGGYEDDEDIGDVLIYTGHGGQDKLHRQCQHQKLEGGNLAMERSKCYGIEVRVIRGFKYENSISSKVYVYDGLYRIVDCWFDVGKSGFGVFKFKLVRIEGQPELGSAVMKFAQMLRTKPLTARPSGYISFDISCNKEKVPVYLYNDMDADREPLYYEYIDKSAFPPFVSFQGDNNLIGCDCVSDCNDDCPCARKNGGQFAYDYSGNLMRGKQVIFECGTLCKCSLNCRNRVTQKGLRIRLEVFRSKETGWGVRTLDLIQAGAFICEYAGVALTREQAQILSMNGDTLIYPGRFTEKWGMWGDLSQIYPDHVRPSFPSLPPLDFAMDVSRMRNVACYISHSNEPNVLVQYVLYDHNNLMFPRVMLFALENIPPLVELSLDYGVADEWSGKLSICN
ncbi:PREDICTED: histone-lysine N-methyltransferase family member SUVH2 [Tarenaya hassleriana]|uniref:histone-lysine N-methyltransferase family member SUVH2 n=1 Tax=Tarenaya hassleriana TaxID=28532 RepID=UPI00053C35AF|nr:PREDICTED: histone-lysine N-methyltransferase family member SUVH2 [Tarenaya hassleriana]